MSNQKLNQDKYQKDWLKFLDEDEVKFQLLTASLYITTYDLLINSIIKKIEDFYSNGFDENGLIISEDYKTKVKSLCKKDIVIASLKWLVNNKVFTEKEFERIKEFKEHRNQLAHELTKIISESDKNTETRFIPEIRDLYFKLLKWWFIEFEMQINPDLGTLDIDKLDFNEVLMMQMLPMNYMTNIVNDEIAKKDTRISSTKSKL